MEKRYRILIWIVVALILLLAGAVWLARDWPRQQVLSALARALDAEVDLGRLEIRDRRTVVLHRLGIRDPRSYPWFESLSVDRLTVIGSLGEILDNRFETIVLDGVEVSLRENSEPMPARQDEAGVEVGRLQINDGRIIVRDEEGESRLDLSGEITGLGQVLGGEVRFRSEQLSLVPLLGFAVGAESVSGFAEDSPLDLDRPVEGVEIDVHLGQPDATAILEARASGGIPFRDPQREPLVFPDLRLRLDQGPGGEWRFTSGAVSPGLATLEMEGGMAADGSSPWIDRAVLDTDDPVLLLYFLGLVPESVAARGRAKLTLERTGGSPPICRVNAEVHDLELPRGGSEGISGDSLQLDRLCPLELTYEGTLEKDVETGDWLTAGRAVLTSASAGELNADGSLLFGGSENSLDAIWNWSGPALPDLRRLAATGFGFQWPKRYRVDGAPRAAGRVSGPLDEPVFSGAVEVDGVEFCLESGGEPTCPLALNRGTLTAGFHFQETRGLRLPGLSLSGDLSFGPLDSLPLSLSTSGRIDPSTLEGRFEDLSVTLGELARTTGEGRWNQYEDPPLTAAIRLEEVNLPAIRRALVPFTGQLLSGYELEVAVSGGFDAVYSASGVWTADGVIEMGEAWFASDDGARAVQGLASRWLVMAEAGPDSALRAEASTAAGGFQLLWGSVFGDFQELQPRIRFAAGLDGEEGSDGDWWAEGDLQPVPGVRLQGSLAGGRGPGREFSASFVVDDLATAFEQCALRPLGDSLPLLVRLDAAGGIHAIAEGRVGEDGAALRGRVRLDGLDLTGVERTMAVRGLDLDLPLDLAWGPPAEDGARPVDGAARRGRMGFDELSLDTLTFQRTDSGLVVQGDTVSLEASQSIPLLGGTVTFHRMTLVGLLGAERHLETGLSIDGVQLAELSRTLAWPLFEGVVEGHLPRVVLSPTRLRVDGGGEISLFGGTVSISDISGEEVLSRYPRLSFSAEFHGIDLARFTRTFDFGEITGILEGRVSDCRLFAGTPVGFRAEMRTVPRAGVSQTINVKAINNIAIIGTGGRVTLFDRGIHSLLDRYTYEQLGVKMRLEKDMFYVRGTEHRGDKELFLKGRLPFRIDVVNAEPGRTVSFSTMLARLQALDFSQAVTDTGGGPQ